jgi:hypothetical protein
VKGALMLSGAHAASPRVMLSSAPKMTGFDMRR